MAKRNMVSSHLFKVVVNIDLFWQILKLFEEPEYWLKIKREKDELLNGLFPKEK